MLFRVQLPLAAAGDHRRHPHRDGPGRRHRHAGHAGRRHEPGQLHLRRPGKSESPGHGVRLRLSPPLLAVVLDQLVRLLELAARRRSRRLAWVGGGGLLLVFGGGLAVAVRASASTRGRRP